MEFLECLPSMIIFLLSPIVFQPLPSDLGPTLPVRHQQACLHPFRMKVWALKSSIQFFLTLISRDRRPGPRQERQTVLCMS